MSDSHAGKNYLGIAVCFDAYEGTLKLETADIKKEMKDIVKILKTKFHYKFPYEDSMPEGLNTLVNPKDLMRSLKMAGLPSPDEAMIAKMTQAIAPKINAMFLCITPK